MNTKHKNDREFISAVLDRLLQHPDPAQALDILEKLLAQYSEPNNK